MKKDDEDELPEEEIIFKKISPEFIKELISEYKDKLAPITIIMDGNYEVYALDFVYSNMGGNVTLHVIDTLGFFHILNNHSVLDVLFNYDDEKHYIQYNTIIEEARIWHKLKKESMKNEEIIHRDVPGFG